MATSQDARRYTFSAGATPPNTFSFTLDLDEYDDIAPDWGNALSVWVIPIATPNTPVECTYNSGTLVSGEYQLNSDLDQITFFAGYIKEGDIVIMQATTPNTRSADYTTSNFYGPVVNQDLDRIKNMVQENSRDIQRSITMPIAFNTDSDTFDPTLPYPLTADKSIGINAAGDGLELKDIDDALLASLGITDRAVVVGDGGGQNVTDTNVLIDSSDNITGVNDLTVSGDVTFTGISSVTPTTSDKVVLQDASDSDNTKTATVEDILDLVTSASNIITNVYNSSGSTILKGQAIHISGFHVGTNEPEVGLADNTVSANMPSHGLASADIANNDSGEVIAYGVLDNINTSSYTEGDSLYVNASGGLTNVRPTGATHLVQKIAVVTRSHSSNGSVVVSGAGRVNDTPNTIDAVDGNFSGTVTGSNLSGTNTGDQDASGVSIADAGGLYTATDVEGALAEVKTIADSGTGDALTTNPLSQFASTTSAQLAGVISDEEGTGALVFANSPSLTTPDIGTPSAGTLTNCTGLPASGVGSGTFADARVASSNVTQHIADIKPTESIMLACSDETTDLTTGTAKLTFRMPYAFTVTEVRASVSTAPVGSAINVDINYDNGGVQTSILSTLITIDGGDKTSETAGVPPQISTSSISDDNEMTIDIDQVGATTAGTGLKVTLIGART